MFSKNSSSDRIRFVALVVFLCLGCAIRARQFPSLLWEISGNELAHPSYLYGTVHSFDSSAFRFLPVVAPKIAASDVFAMEMLLEAERQNFMELLQYVVMPGDTSLSMLLGSAEYERLSRYLTDSLDIPMMLLGNVKPFFIIGMMMGQSMTNADAARFLDDSLAQIATLAGKKVIGIETMQEQLGSIDRIPLHEQARMLMEEVDSAISSSSTNEMNELIDTYASGSLDSLYALYKDKELSNSFQRALVTDRNHRMANRIAERLAGKNLRMFVAIGALHLPGEEGVINLLRKKGYSVTPIALN